MTAPSDLEGLLARVEAVAWIVTYSDSSAFLVFTEDDADEAMADALPGATKAPLYPASALSSYRALVEALEAAGCVDSARTMRNAAHQAVTAIIEAEATTDALPNTPLSAGKDGL